MAITTAQENDAEQLALAELNPLRYRGYYYDNETGLYYLQSRYYNPDIGRFISSDSFDYIDADEKFTINAYGYCANNPIAYSDPTGYELTWGTILNIIAISITIDALFPLFRISSSSSSHNTNSRPMTGKPGSTYHTPDGSYREFDNNGLPKLDYDSHDHGDSKNHPHDENGGHYHDWNGKVRGDPYVISTDSILNIIAVVLTIILIVFFIFDDSLVIGTADDFVLAPLFSLLRKFVVG